MLKVIRPGIQASVQDLGRRGHRHSGVAQSGALDHYAMTQANYLLGNTANEATIEIAAGPFEIAAQGKVTATVTGHRTKITKTGNNGSVSSIRTGQVFFLLPGDHLTIEPKDQLGRCYLALQGGVDVPLVLGSRSTDIAAGFGGFEGRCLQRNDIIISQKSNPATLSSMKERFAKPESSGHTIRVIPGPEYPYLTVSSQQQLWLSDWKTSTESNRMGCRLIESPHRDSAKQKSLKLIDGKTSLSHSMPSHAVIPGTIQLPPQGMPIILLADCQTTGGYPRIGQVIEADLWRLAQMSVNSLFRLVECDRKTAVNALRDQRQTLYRFELACQQK